MEEFQSELVALLPRLRRFACALVRSDADAQDLVQETVERALSRRHAWIPGTRLDSWTYTIMKRLFIDKNRARRRWNRVMTPENDYTVLVADVGQADEALRVDALAARNAIHALPEDQRLAVALVLVDGLSYAEAAGVMGVPVGTLTSRLVRGRQSLVETLERQGVST
ncbi:MAG: RNA polymerase sigma factor [Brevundimonas sp.]|uniref:RNA polymerase sigma factor n=1 Tax=Brevundimonas sp. TaxID=1871086 RepID=UPI0024881CB4|nr:RNA polymerase sigma factor [Brevundimonas sp.]MDI1326086.1 RNA polymerase sigma factor [Brevundimonas sp.]